jgi:hypothetical protein
MAASRRSKLATMSVRAGQAIAVRDSKDALGSVLVFGQRAWRQLAAKVKTERLC